MLLVEKPVTLTLVLPESDGSLEAYTMKGEPPCLPRIRHRGSTATPGLPRTWSRIRGRR